MPFELELAACDSEVARCSGTTDLRACKMVTAIHCLSVNAPQVLGNEPDGGRSLLKPRQLRMMGVPMRLSPKDGLGKKSFPPQGNKAASVEVFRMQTPDSHYCLPLPPRQHLPGPGTDPPGHIRSKHLHVQERCEQDTHAVHHDIERV